MVKIVCDSASDLPNIVTSEYDIRVVPNRILFGGKAYRDGVDIDSTVFYRKLTSSYFHPLTTQASPLDYYRAFREIADAGEDVICITLPFTLSKNMISAQQAAREILDVNVSLYSSGGVSGHQGLLVMHAAQLAQQGYSSEEILAHLDTIKPRTTLFAVASTLEYLIRGGRLSVAEGKFGGLLRVYPIVKTENDNVINIDKILFGNTDKAIAALIDNIGKIYSHEEPVNCMVLHAVNPSGAAILTDEVKQYLNVEEVITTRIGATIGANIGPGALGVAISPALPYLGA